MTAQSRPSARRIDPIIVAQSVHAEIATSLSHDTAQKYRTATAFSVERSCFCSAASELEDENFEGVGLQPSNGAEHLLFARKQAGRAGPTPKVREL